MSRKIACIESPFNGTPSERERNCRYAAWCYLDSAVRGEAPHVGHLLGPQAHAEDVIWRGVGLQCDMGIPRARPYDRLLHRPRSGATGCARPWHTARRWAWRGPGGR